MWEVDINKLTITSTKKRVVNNENGIYGHKRKSDALMQLISEVNYQMNIVTHESWNKIGELEEIRKEFRVLYDKLISMKEELKEIESKKRKR